MLRRSHLNRLTLQFDEAFIRMFHAGEDFDQSGFPGPILTHQRMNLPFSQGEIYIFKGNDTRKGFGDAFHGDKALSVGHIYHLPFTDPCISTEYSCWGGLE